MNTTATSQTLHRLESIRNKTESLNIIKVFNQNLSILAISYFLTVGHSWFKIPFDNLNVALLTTSALCKSVPLRLNELQMKVGRVVRWLTRVDVPYMKPSTQVQAMSPVYHLRLICRTLSPVGWLWHASVILSRVALLGRVRWADGRILTMPYLPPYTDRDPILSGETKPLWTRPPGHGGCAQICLCLPIDPTQIYQYGTFGIAQGLRSHIDLVRIRTTGHVDQIVQ